MKIYLGTDHGGFKLKEELAVWLDKAGHEVVDVGAHQLDRDDDFTEPAFAVADQIQMEGEARGILLCRNGVGVSIVANRFSDVRCVLGFNAQQVEKARNDDDVNCLAIPADYLKEAEVKEIIEKFLATDFSGEDRFVRRIMKLEEGTSSGGGCGCGGSCGGACDHGGCGHC